MGGWVGGFSCGSIGVLCVGRWVSAWVGGWVGYLGEFVAVEEAGDGLPVLDEAAEVHTTDKAVWVGGWVEGVVGGWAV